MRHLPLLLLLLLSLGTSSAGHDPPTRALEPTVPVGTPTFALGEAQPMQPVVFEAGRWTAAVAAGE